MNKTITFFTQNKTKCEQAVRPIADEADKRAFTVEFTGDGV